MNIHAHVVSESVGLEESGDPFCHHIVQIALYDVQGHEILQHQSGYSEMNVTVGDTVSAIASVGRASDGSLFAQAQTALADGSYQVKVSYRQTQVLDLLFN